MSITCPVCDETHFDYQFIVRGRQVMRCRGCGCVAVDGPRANMDRVAELTDAEALSPYLPALQRRGYRDGPLLVATCTNAVPATYAGAMVIDRLQAETAPGEFLDGIHAALRPGAPLLMVVPDIDGLARPVLPARRPAGASMRPPSRCCCSGMDFRTFWSGAHNRRLWATAVQAARVARPKCSIIVAAFNESQTFPILMEALLRKEIAGVDREVIVVESNSTDGTRELAQRYQGHPDIKLVFEERPRGKGYAIREGLRQATGDVILIHRTPTSNTTSTITMHCSRPFFLIARCWSSALAMAGTSEDAAVRTAEEPGGRAELRARIPLLTLINVLYRQNMTDPFTMFKRFFAGLPVRPRVPMQPFRFRSASWSLNSCAKAISRLRFP